MGHRSSERHERRATMERNNSLHGRRWSGGVSPWRKVHAWLNERHTYLLDARSQTAMNIPVTMKLKRIAKVACAAVCVIILLAVALNGTGETNSWLCQSGDSHWENYRWAQFVQPTVFRTASQTESPTSAQLSLQRSTTEHESAAHQFAPSRPQTSTMKKLHPITPSARK